MRKITSICLVSLAFVIGQTLASEWQARGLDGRQVLSIAIDLDNIQYICAGTDSGLYVSFNGGQSWVTRITEEAQFPFVGYAPLSPDTLIALAAAGSVSDGLYISTDSGNAWANVANFTNPRRLGFDPVNPGFVYLCFADGILSSQDYGQNVAPANSGLPDTDILDVIGDGTNQLEAYAVGQTFVAHTTNFGNNWTTVGGQFPLEDYNPSRISFDPSTPETLYVSCYAYFARSFNGGLSWVYTAMTSTENSPIVCDPQTAGKLFVGSNAGGGVQVSGDAGASFTAINENLGNLDVFSLAIDSQNHLYAGTANGLYFYDLSAGIDNGNENLPETPSLLSQNYPNPFNASTRISLSLAQNQSGCVEIFDISGRLVKTLFEGIGSHILIWDGIDNDGAKMVSGIYFYRLTTPGHIETHKMLFLK